MRQLWERASQTIKVTGEGATVERDKGVGRRPSGVEMAREHAGESAAERPDPVHTPETAPPPNWGKLRLALGLTPLLTLLSIGCLRTVPVLVSLLHGEDGPITEARGKKRDWSDPSLITSWASILN